MKKLCKTQKSQQQKWPSVIEHNILKTNSLIKYNEHNIQDIKKKRKKKKEKTCNSNLNKNI